ncbi:MAG: helix-hairpin-helix domain-containing protein [Gemmatimonadaceae bacterium]
MTERRGFAMITVLWVMMIATIVATTGALAGRNAVNGARNRTELRRAFWIANECASHIRAAIDDSLAAALAPEAAAETWRLLGRQALASTPDECDANLDAAGTRLDVNTTSDTVLTALFRELGYGERSTAMVDALEDWKDSDDVARPQGAEREWYRSERRELPRNGPIASLRELTLVRGFEDLSTLDTVVSTEPGRVSLATASATVLSAVPGLTRETADRIAEMRDAGTPVRSVLDVLPMVSRSSADLISAHYPEIARLTTPDPDAWTLSVSASSGYPPNRATIEWRLVRIEKRAVITRTVSNF